MSGGFILLHRKLMLHWLYESERPFTKREAWIDLLFLAAYKVHSRELDGKLANLEVGDIPTSMQQLAGRWHWTWRRVRTFLKTLENDGMIRIVKHTHNSTILKLNNYAYYQLKTEGQDTTTNIATSTLTRSPNSRASSRTYKKKGANKEKQKNNDGDFLDDDAWMKGALGYGDS